MYMQWVYGLLVALIIADGVTPIDSELKETETAIDCSDIKHSHLEVHKSAIFTRNRDSCRRCNSTFPKYCSDTKQLN